MSKPTNIITNDLVIHLSKLAALPLSDDEVEKFQQELNGISQTMETIKQLDLADVPETSRTTEEENVWRDDEVKLSFSQAEALQNAAKKYKGFYLVPLVLIGKDAP